MTKFFVIVFCFLIPLTACQSNPDPEPINPLTLEGDPDLGRELVQMPLLGETPAPGCRNCHSIEEDAVLVGPSFLSMASSSETYLLEGIVDPDKTIAEGFVSGAMYPNYQEDLTAQEIAHIIAFIQSLEPQN
ncbi:MAG: c-type cytochrome [Ardenticatenaceae bacterium]|nr:c-type cytochrome [Ardenticatenaceae bacterium]